ncbi:hypothetical protein D3C73_433370 [compost metagenome]
MKHQDKPVIPTGAVIASMVLFPLGLLLLIVRLIAHWKSPLRRIRDVKLGAGIAAFFFIFMTIIILFNSKQEDGVVMGVTITIIVFVLPPLLIFNVYRNKEQDIINEYEAYRKHILEQRLSTVDQIAATMGKSPRKVAIDIKDMIRQLLLPGVVLDPHSQAISLTYDADQQQVPLMDPQEIVELPVQSEPAGEAIPVRSHGKPTKTVECQGCGNRVQLSEDETKYCEYCGSGLQYA